MSRKKGKAQHRRQDWNARAGGEEVQDRARGRERFAPKAAKVPSWRQEGDAENIEALPRLDAMVIGLMPGAAIVRAQGRELICGLAGTFRPPEGSSALAVGDVVTIALASAPPGQAVVVDKLRTDGAIISRQNRRTLLGRPQPRSGKHHDRHEDETYLKVIAANMDQLLIVSSTVQPKLRTALIERFLIIAERGDLKTLLAINKIDLHRPEEETLDDLRAVGIDPILVSAWTGEGMADLRAHLAGKSTVLAGASGVGKSTLVNALVPGAEAATREIRMKDQRGRHTTAAAAVYNLPAEGGEAYRGEGILPLGPTGVPPADSKRQRGQDALATQGRDALATPDAHATTGGMLIDTPGVRELAVELDLSELPWYFPEFWPLAPNCRFRDCSHTHEPDCAVIAAVESGAVRPQRYESYLRLVENLQK